MKKRPPTVVLVGHLPPPYTGQTVALDMLRRHLPEHGFEVAVCDTGAAEAGDRAERAVRSKGLRRMREILSALARLPRMLCRSDLLYLALAQGRAGFFRDLAVVSLATLAARPMVAHLHGGNYLGFYGRCSPGLKFLVRWILRRTARIIVLGELLRDQFNFDPSLAEKVVVVHNGVPFDAPATPIEEKDWRKGAPLRILYLSNMHESKGYGHVLEACRVLHEDGVQFDCGFCGQFNEDRDRERFTRAVAQHGLQSCVHYKGRVIGKDKERVLGRSHVLVLPTNYVNEGQPISVLEGMAYGLAIVTTPYRGLPELVEHGCNGFLVEFARPDQIADRLRQLADDRQQLKAFCKTSHQRFREQFRRETHIERMAQVFTSVLAEANGVST